MSEMFFCTLATSSSREELIKWLVIIGIYLLFRFVRRILSKGQYEGEPQPSGPPEPSDSGPVGGEPPGALEGGIDKPIDIVSEVAESKLSATIAAEDKSTAQEVLAPLATVVHTTFRAMNQQEVVSSVDYASSMLVRAACKPEFPITLCSIVDALTTRLLRTSTQLQEELIKAAGLEDVDINIRGLQDLQEQPWKLAVGFLEEIFADGLGITLFGPEFVRCRVVWLAQKGRKNRIEVTQTKHGAVLVAPLILRGPYLLAMVQALNFSTELHPLQLWLEERYPEEKSDTVEFGLGYASVRLPASPLIQRGKEFAGKVAAARMETLGSKSLQELVAENGIGQAWTGAKERFKVMKSKSQHLHYDLPTAMGVLTYKLDYPSSNVWSVIREVQRHAREQQVAEAVYMDTSDQDTFASPGAFLGGIVLGVALRVPKFARRHVREV